MTDTEIREFVEYLENTLMPDLLASGMTEMWEDFVTCVAIIQENTKGRLDVAA